MGPGGIHRPELAAAPEPCAGCGSTLATDQRYCVSCGTRRGAPRVDPLLALPAAPAGPSGPATRPATVADGGASWGAPFHAGRVQPIVPAVTALLASLLIGVTSSPGTASSAPAPGSVLVQLPAPASALPAPALPGLGLLPPSVSPVAPEPEAPAVAAIPVADPPAPEPADDAPASAPDPEPDAEDEAPAPAGDDPVVLKHVFLITLSDQPAARTYAPDSAAPFLSRTLAARGVLLPNHHAVTRGGLANTMAMLSGQGPTPETQAGCPTYSDLVTPASTESPGADGQELGSGCVRSAVTGTIADQLRGNEKDWAAYVDGMGARQPPACSHPPVGAPDDTVAGRPGDAYATARNPLLYFHSTIDDDAACKARDKDLGLLAADLVEQGEDFPALAYIAPSPMRSGTDAPYTPGQPAGGLAAADAFLREWVPRIEKSKAYADGGLIVITTDQTPEPAAGGATGASGATGPTGATGPEETTSCCLEPAYPNVPAGQPGGGRVGLLLLAKNLKAPGSTLEDPTNHFDLLRSLEDGFGLPALGYAARDEVKGLPLAAALDTSPE